MATRVQIGYHEHALSGVRGCTRASMNRCKSLMWKKFHISPRTPAYVYAPIRNQQVVGSNPTVGSTETQEKQGS